MTKSIYRFAILLTFVSLFLASTEKASAQKRKIRPAKKVAVETISDEEKAATFENLQGAKVFQLLAELQLGLAEAYVEDRAAGELKANAALSKLSIEMLRKPNSLYTIYAHAKGYGIWTNYYLDREGFGKNAKIDKEIKDNIEVIRRSVPKGLAINPNSAQMIAVRGALREFDCRIGLNSSDQDCFDLPLADFSRAIALMPDELDFYYMRAEFFERQGKNSLAEQDNQSAKSLGNAMELKLQLDKAATARRPYHLERANAEMLYFMHIVSLLLDENVKVQLNYDSLTLKSFRDKLMEYYALADDGYLKAATPKPTAETLERRGTLRYHLAIFAKDLGVEQPAEYARKNFEEAVAFYTDAVKLDAKFAAAYQNRARAFRKIGKLDLAEADEKQYKLLAK